ncbi:MAG: protein kinase [Acidobacteriota bacterium]
MKESLPIAGTTVSHYRILQRLGAGGMGEVYLAEDTELDRKVAIKFLSVESALDEGAKKRLIREARAAAKLDHPNICAIHEVGEDQGRSFIVMQFVEGETLGKLIQRKPLDLRESLDIAVQIAGALAEAHSRGIVHRDIKPQNVMITARGQVKVLDFGLAKIVQQKSLADSAAETDSLLTEPGMIIGTVPYMSPEQVRGETLDARSDIFSFGAVVYEMVSGHQPFAAESAAATISTILTKEPPPLARYSREVPGELERIVSKALRKDREQRYQTAKDLLIDLKSLRDHLEFEAKLERSKSPDLMAGAAVATNQEHEMVETASQPAVQTGDVAARTTSSAAYLISNALRNRRGLALVVATLVIAVAGIAYFAGRGKAIDSIAVLPFVNVSADPNTEYLSDGITESLINILSQLPDLKVISRSSVFRYKAKDVDPQAVGRELKVQAVLTGRIIQRGDGLSISAELMDARDNSHIWGEQYNRKLADLLTVQQEISREISEKLRIRLTSEEQRRVAKRYTDNVEAYQLYLKGRYHLNRLTDDGFMKGRDYFQGAIDKDPNYALAYAGLADAYNALSGWGALPPKEGYPRASAAAMKALELNDELAEAHTSLGTVKFFYDWNWSGAEREFRRAIEINQSYPDAHQMYSYYLSAMGRFDEALAEMRRAQELDPLSLVKIAGIGEVLFYKRQYDQAIEQYQKALEMDPNSGFAHWAIGNVYVQKGMYKEAISEYQRSIPLSGDSPDEPASLGYAYALSGKRREAQQVIDELKERSKRRHISPAIIAFIYMGLGEKDQAFAWLDKAYEERDSILVLLKVEPMFDSLRSDSRFAALLRRAGF